MVKFNVNPEGKTVLVTGAAGFIGSNLVKRLLRDVESIRIVGVDSMYGCYDSELKYARLRDIGEAASGRNWLFVKGDIADKEFVETIFKEHKPAVVMNLAARAGVRESATDPDSYIRSNVLGFCNILEGCRNHPVEHLVYASSSSVYGCAAKVPYSTDDKADSPVSLYAATKRSDELFAYAYSKLYRIPCTGLRFFTAYGPAGRPDMAYFKFTDRFIKGEKIQVFNYGNCERDFTYIDDVIEATVRVMRHAPEEVTRTDGLQAAPHKVYNIGNGSPVKLLDFITVLQEELLAAGVLPPDYDFEAHKEFVPMQPGDVPVTFADTAPLEEDFGFKPGTSLRSGLRTFARWYASTVFKG